MEESASKKRTSSRVWTWLFIAFNVLVIGGAAYMDFGAGNRLPQDVLAEVRPWYLLAATGLFTLTIAAETLKYRFMLRSARKEGRVWRTAFEVAVLGKYYDNVTPFGAGGQPFQMLYLSRSGVSNGSAAAIPLAGYMASHAAFILIALAVLISGPVIGSAALLAPAIVGLLCYAAIPLALVLFSLAPVMTERMLGGVLALLGRLRIVKNPQARKAALEGDLRAAITSIRVIGRRLLWRSLLLSLVYHTAICSMPFFVLRAFGNDMAFLEVFRSCVFIYLCVTFIPTPGNAGAAEGSFYALFSVLGQTGLFWAMLVWRFFCFYAYILLGFLVTFREASRRRARGG